MRIERLPTRPLPTLPRRLSSPVVEIRASAPYSFVLLCPFPLPIDFVLLAMSETADHLAARLFEAKLREQAEADPRDTWELLWLLGLPPSVRRSYLCVLEAKIDQDATRSKLRRQSCFRQRNWRQPSSFEVHCMSIEPVHPWLSLGRREHRRKVDVRSSMRPPLPSSHLLRPSRRVRFQFPTRHGFTQPVTIDPDAVPERPLTPPGLRDWIHSDSELVLEAGGLDSDTENRHYSHTPLAPATPSLISSPNLCCLPQILLPR